MDTRKMEACKHQETGRIGTRRRALIRRRADTRTRAVTKRYMETRRLVVVQFGRVQISFFSIT